MADVWDVWKATEGQRWRAWWIARHPPEVGGASWSLLFEGGKEIRPRLFTWLWECLAPDQPVCAEAGFIVECVHVATLILDDLPWMDDATERRGRPALHRVFSVRKALLLAVDVLAMAWEVIQVTPWLRNQWEAEPERWRAWGREIAYGLWMGQWWDLSTASDGITAYERAALKTGTLFEAVAKGVAWAHGMDGAWWGAWGRTVGVLFQWVDDADDLEEDRRTGKPNAWNEPGTTERYREEWQRVVQGAGSAWKTPFGERLYRYLSRPLGSRGAEAKILTSVIGIGDIWPNGSSVLRVLGPVSPVSPVSPADGLGIAFLRWFAPLFRSESFDLPFEDLDALCLWGIDEEKWSSILETRWPAIAPAIQWMERHLSAS